MWFIDKFFKKKKVEKTFPDNLTVQKAQQEAKNSRSTTMLSNLYTINNDSPFINSNSSCHNHSYDSGSSSSCCSSDSGSSISSCSSD